MEKYSLQYFIKRNVILSQYRKTLKLLNHLPLNIKEEMMKEIRFEYKKNVHLANLETINKAIQYGKTQQACIEQLLLSTQRKKNLTKKSIPSMQLDDNNDETKSEKNQNTHFHDNIHKKLNNAWPWNRKNI